MSIRERFDDHAKKINNDSMKSVNECISDMIKYVKVMIDSAYLYHDNLGSIRRRISSGGYEYAPDDIKCIDESAFKCFDLILKHKYLNNDR